MASANARLRDEAIGAALDQRLYANGVVRRVIAALNRQDARLSYALAQALDGMPATEFTVERLEVLLASVRSINAEAYAAAMAELQGGMQGAAQAATAQQYATLAGAVPAAVLARYPLTGVAWDQAYAAALSRPFQGRLLSGWAANVEASRMTLIRNAIRAGYMDGLTTAQIVQQIRGTRALKYSDGILDRSRREVEAVVRTALSHTAATARGELYGANADLIKAIRWDSTIDTRTTKHICVPRDGKLYDPGTHKPIGHNFPWLQGPGRAHWNCRSVDIPVLKSFRELGIDIDDIPPGQRSSMDGAVPSDTTYLDWLGRQSAARQDEVLGPERGKLYREGKITLPNMYDEKGRWLTLDELKRRAGL